MSKENKNDLKEKLVKIPNDQYACSETNCHRIPEIKDLNYDTGEITINCTDHKEKKMKIDEYFEKEINNIYYCCYHLEIYIFEKYN